MEMDQKLVCLLLVFIVFFSACRGAIIETIQNESGDIFDCVDVKQQPAFQHPLLKNHIIQMEPTSYPTYMSDATASTVSSNIEIETVECPPGTIPIWRNVLQNHTSSNSMWRSWDVLNESISTSEKNTKAYFAIVQKDGSFFGSKASMTIYEPGIGEGEERKTGARINLSNGVLGTKTFDTITAGWAVCPKYFGDKRTRFLIEWVDSTRSGKEDDVCVNLSCGGFVQVSSEIPLGARLQPVSTYGGDQFKIKIEIFKDPKTGDWWLAFGDNRKLVGYWPQSLFKYLNTKAARVSWGGVNDFTIPDPSPPMGSGHFPSEGYKKAAFFENILIIDGSNRVVTPRIDLTHDVVTTNRKCYDVGNIQVGQGGLGFYYGGPPDCRS